MNTLNELNDVKTISNQNQTVTPTLATNKLQGRQISITEDSEPSSGLSLLGKLSAAVLGIGVIAYSVYSTQEKGLILQSNNTTGGEISVDPKTIFNEIYPSDTLRPIMKEKNSTQEKGSIQQTNNTTDGEISVDPKTIFNETYPSDTLRPTTEAEIKEKNNTQEKGSIQQINNTTSGEICVDPKTIFDEIYLSGSLRPITEAEMEVKFGLEQRSMTTTETREFYNIIAKANREFGDKLIKEFGNNATQLHQGASACCETRHNAKVYVRKLGPAMGEMFAKALDFSRHWDTEGLRCKSLFKKYKNNPRIVIDKAASPNNDVNRFAENLDKGIMHAVSIEIKALFA